MRPAMSPDGVSVLSLTPPSDSGFHQPLRIMRVALAGGKPQSLGEIQTSEKSVVRARRTSAWSAIRAPRNA